MFKINKNATSGLGKDTIKLTTSKIITLVINTLTSMILVRVRTLEEFGTYSAILIVINLFTALLMLGLPNSINYFLARAETKQDKKHFLSVYFTISFILSIITGLSLVLATPLIELYFNNYDISKFFFFVALYPWTSAVILSLDNVLVVYKKTSILVVFKIIYSAVMLLSVLVIHWLGYGFVTYMVVVIIANCLFSICAYLICAKISGGIRPLLDKTVIRAIFLFSIPIGLSTLVGTLSIELDKLLIGRLMESSQLAIYTNAAKELPLTIIASSVTAILLPQMAILIKNKKEKEAVDLWGDSTVFSFIFISLISTGIFVYAEDVMTLLYSEKYLPGINVFRIYCLTMLIRCTYFGMILSSKGKTKKILYCSIANLALNAALNPLFYLVFGMIGPAVATVLSMIATSVFMLYLTSKETHLGFKAVFPWKKLYVIMLINIIFGVAFYGIKRTIPLEKYVGSLVESLILGIVWATIYFSFIRKQITHYWKKINK